MRVTNVNGDKGRRSARANVQTAVEVRIPNSQRVALRRLNCSYENVREIEARVAPIWHRQFVGVAVNDAAP